MARNDSSIFLNTATAPGFCHENYLVLTTTHTTVLPTAASQNVLAFIHESLWYCVTALACIEILHKQKIFVGFQISWGQPSTKIKSLENLTHEIFSHENFRVYGRHKLNALLGTVS